MSEAAEIVQLVVPYLGYLTAPILLFASLAYADGIVSFAVELMRKVKNGYRV